MDKKNELIFAFDVGLGSLGLAVRKGNDIIHADSLLIDPSVAGLKDQRERRRQFRTRQAHQKREKAWDNIWQKIGETPLENGKPVKENGEWRAKKIDPKFNREFAKKGDKTLYTSCLLRIALLEGQKLETWQIYKAIRSALQRRGYDKNVPWQSGHTEEQKKDNKITVGRMTAFEKKLKEISNEEKHHYPCYYDAYQLGLWRNGKIIRNRLMPSKVKPVPVHKYDGKNNNGTVAPRESVEKEIKQLLEQAAKQLPKLKEYIDKKGLDNILYGDVEQSTNSNKYPVYSFKENEYGLLSQKYPRFDNRLPGQCCLIPRLNVCKKAEPLFIQVRFLLALLNFRYIKEDKQADKDKIIECALTVNEIKNFYDEKLQLKTKEENLKEQAKIFKWTEKEVTNAVKLVGGSYTKGEHKKIEKIDNLNGRCRYSRPALLLLKAFILSGESPHDFHQQLLANAKRLKNKTLIKAKYGDHIITIDGKSFCLFKNELDFIKKMPNIGDQGRHFYLPQPTLAEQHAAKNSNKDKKIEQLILSCRNPIVSHRLQFFHQQLDKLIKEHGEPQHVCMEFVRDQDEDIASSKKRKKRYIDERDKGRKARMQAKEQLPEHLKEKSPKQNKNIKRMRLMQEQGNRCVYTDESLYLNKLEDYDIDHILPRSLGGPDSLYNMVLTTQEINRCGKKDNIPYKSLIIKNDDWESYKQRVERLKDPKKRKLLLATSVEEAKEIAERYMGLAVTSYLAKLVRDLVCLKLGWQPGEKDVKSKISIISGGLTNKVARDHEIYKILGDRNSDPYQKNRDDKRHHALDAMIIAYIPQWARDKHKIEKRNNENKETVYLPSKDYFAKKLQTVHPRMVSKVKGRINEQPYAKRIDKEGKEKITQKKERERKTYDFSGIIYRDIRKDKNTGRGHYYTSYKDNKSGSYTNGVLLVYEIDEGKVSKLNTIPIHGHTSVYEEKQKQYAQGRKTYLLQRGMLITIDNQYNIPATQIGPSIQITKSYFGSYKVTEKLKNDYKVETYQEQKHNTFIVTKNSIEKMYKKREAKQLLKTGGIYNFEKPLIDKSKNLSIDGKYNITGKESYQEEVKLTQPESGKTIEVNYKNLRDYLINNGNSYQFSKGDTIEIDSDIETKAKAKAKLLDKNKILPSERYYIVGFANSMKIITLRDNTGKKYRLSITNLKKIMPDLLK